MYYKIYQRYFLLRLTDYLVMMVVVLKIATPQQRSCCVLQPTKCGTAVQRAFGTQFHMEPGSRVSIYAAILAGVGQQITTAIAPITRDTQHKVWYELNYSLDICRVNRRAHIQFLCG